MTGKMEIQKTSKFTHQNKRNKQKMKKINLRKTDAIMNVGTMAVLANGSRATAQKIADFARRPVYWGNELIGAEWAMAEI